MTPDPQVMDRKAGERCCLPLPEHALDEGEVDVLTADLEILANPIRLRLLSALGASREPACVCDLEGTVPVKQPTVSHHLRLLRSAGLIDSERRGLWTYYFIRDEALEALRERVSEGLARLGP